MKHPVLKDTFREIWKTKSRFFSIFGIAAIGVAFFAGICASAPTMAYNADTYFDEHQLMDYRILSNFGITQEDVDAISQMSEIEGIMPAYSADVLVNDGQSLNVMRVHSLDNDLIRQNDENYLNQLIVVEGRLPQKLGEIVVEKTQMLENSFEIGKTIELKGADDDLSSTFSVTNYKIVGIVQTPYYLSFQKGPTNIGSGTLGFYGYVLEENFNMEVYTEVYVSVKGAQKYNTFDQEYFDAIEKVTKKLERLGLERSELRRGQIMDAAMEEYNKGYAAYEEGKALFESEIAAAGQALHEGELELVKGQAELDAQKASVQKQMDDAQEEIDEGKAKIEEYTELLKVAENTYYVINKDTLERRDEAAANIKTAEEEKSLLESELKEVNAQLQMMDDLSSAHDEAQLAITQLNLEMSTLNITIMTLKTSLSSPLLSDERKAELQIELDQAQLQYDEAQRKLDEYQAILDNSESVDVSQRVELLMRQSELNSQIQSCNDRITLYQSVVDAMDTVLQPVEDLMGELKKYMDDAMQQVVDGQKQLDDAKIQAERGFKEGQKKIDEGYLQLEEGRVKLEEEKLKGQLQLEDAYEELVRGREQIEQIEQAQWYVLDRNSHYSYVDYQGAIDRMDAIAVIFPVFFFLVAALVCLTTMTRMVDEQRTQIGTMKALGYDSKAIAFKYVFYAAFASLMGCLVGLTFGLIAFPAIIYTAWNMMYILPPVRFTTHIPLMIVSTLLIVSVTTLSTLFACYSELVETPSLLMRPKAPKLGKKILLERVEWLWSRFSFTSKVTARNIFRYKKRFFMTVIGISGCTALLIAGFGVKDSINAIVDRQFNEVFHYIGTATLTQGLQQQRIDEIVDETKKSDLLENVMAVHCASSVLEIEDETMDTTLMVVKDGDLFDEFVDLHVRSNGNDLTLDDEGVILTEHMCNQMNIQVGDTVEISNEDGIVREFEVLGITENYVNHFVYMTESCYKDAYDLRAKDNTLLLVFDQDTKPTDGEVSSLLTSYDEVLSVSFYSSIRDNFSSMIASLDMIVVVIILSAGALAFVVLFNLTNVNISERIREIATLKVLGFHHKEVNEYVYNENIILSMIGALFGLIMGKYLHLAIMVMVELDNVMFGRLVKPQSYLYAFVVTLVFTVVVNQVMKKRLREIPMVESLKSVE